MKLKRQNNCLNYTIEYPDQLTSGRTDSYCYLAYLERLDDNLEFRRTFCKKSFEHSKKNKKTAYQFNISQDTGYFELGQQLNEFQYRKIYFFLKNGEFATTDKSNAIVDLTKKMNHEKAEKEKAEKIAKEKKKIKKDAANAAKAEAEALEAEVNAIALEAEI